MTDQIENFIAQYEQETVTKEINANKRMLNGFIWFLGAIGVLWVFTLTGILAVDTRMVSYAFLLAFLLYIPTFYLIQKGKLSKGCIKYFLLTELCILCGILISVLSYHATLLCIFPLLYAIQYHDKKIIWFTFVLSVLTITASEFISYYFGICDLNVLLEGHYNYGRHLASVTEGLLLIPTNKAFLSTLLLHTLLPKSAMLFILSFLLQYTVASNARDSLRIAQLTYYKDTDINTKVYNKNKYEEMITQYYPSVNHLAVIFFDLNSLKKVNDELGHAMGDYIIGVLATAIRSQTNDCRRAYRIGGDEFIMILENPAPGEAELIIALVKEQLNLQNTDDKVTISTAAGFAYGKGSDILKIVSEADEKMYENKAFIKESQK